MFFLLEAIGMAFRRALIGSVMLVASLATAATAGATVLNSTPLHLPGIPFLRSFEQQADVAPVSGQVPAAPAPSTGSGPQSADSRGPAAAPAEVPAQQQPTAPPEVPVEQPPTTPTGAPAQQQPTTPSTVPATTPGAESSPDGKATQPAPSAPAVPAENPSTPAGAPTPRAADPPKPLYQVPTKTREVVLTFDDGPSSYTAPLLQILAEEKVHAAFFWIGGSKGLTRATDVLAQGNQLGSHTMTHVKLTTVTSQILLDELTRSQELLRGASKAEILYFRPPYGSYNAETLKAARDLGMTVVLWNVDSRDWALADHPEQIIPGVMQQVKPGSIILLHERAQTVKILPDLIKILRDAGYTFRLLPAGQ
jgi:peptidoglycan/xylan/chitin deacetylase (PgdA/CDA1 family)